MQHDNFFFFEFKERTLDVYLHFMYTALIPLDSYQYLQLNRHDLKFTHAYFIESHEFHLLYAVYVSRHSTFDLKCLFFNPLLLSSLTIFCLLSATFSIRKVYFNPNYLIYFLSLLLFSLTLKSIILQIIFMFITVRFIIEFSQNAFLHMKTFHFKCCLHIISIFY